MPRIRPGNIINFRMSPDERQVALSRIDATSQYVRHLDRRSRERHFVALHAPSDDRHSPVWSPDGGRVFSRWIGPEENFLFGKTADGRQSKRLVSRAANRKPYRLVAKRAHRDLSPGGGRHQPGLWVSSIWRRRWRRRFRANTIFDESDGRMSPDGRWVAYIVGRIWRSGDLCSVIPQERESWPVSVGGGVEPPMAARRPRVVLRGAGRVVNGRLAAPFPRRQHIGVRHACETLPRSHRRRRVDCHRGDATVRRQRRRPAVSDQHDRWRDRGFANQHHRQLACCSEALKRTKGPTAITRRTKRTCTWSPIHTPR